MVSLRAVEDQLKRAGCNFQLWGRAEVRELCHILMDNEEIQACLNGHYSGGFAMLCSTNQRILLVDKKPMFLTLEDLRYDMVSEVQYSHRLLDATVRIYTPTTSLVFSSWNRTHLRKLVMGAQEHLMAIRQYHQNINSMQRQQLQNQFQQQPVSEPQATKDSPLTMPPLPSPKDRDPYALNPTLTMTTAPISPTTNSQPVNPFSVGTSAMNAFLKTPLITRDRSGFRRW
jgi:hypothetical protein